MGGRCCGFESCGFRVGRWNADRTDGFANADQPDGGQVRRIFSCNPDTYLGQGRKGWNAGESDGFANADF